MTITNEELEQLESVLTGSSKDDLETRWEEDAPSEAVSEALAPAPVPEPVKKLPRSRRDTAASLLKSEGSGTTISCLANAITCLRGFHQAWLGVLAYDEFANCIVTRKSPPWGAAPGAWTSADDIRAADYLHHVGIFVSPKIAAQAADVVSREMPFHPVREFLRSLKWDGKPRLDNWLSTYLGAESTAWTRACGSRWLISGCARIEQPGCQADYCLLLVGRQGTLKSSALKILAGDWFRDHLSSISNKDSRIELSGVWIVELGELASKRSSTHEALKAFLTTRVDSYRPVYGTRTVDYPRQCIFAASTNDANALSDETGNRRFWPVNVGRIDLEALRKDREQLWAEAYARFKKGDSWWLTTRELNELAQAEQDKNYCTGYYDEQILNWCFNPKSAGIIRSVRGKVVASEISECALGVSISEPHFGRVQREIRKCLTHNGWTAKQERISGTSQRVWFWTTKDVE